MIYSDKEKFAGGRYWSRTLAADLPDQLENLTRSHRTFSARAAQELRRAERYRQFLSLIIVGDTRDDGQTPAPDDGKSFAALTDFAATVRVNTRVSDVVSGVERGRFAVLLVETGADGAGTFARRLREMIELCRPGPTDKSESIPLEIAITTFPDHNPGALSFAEKLNRFYQQSNTRPHLG